MGKIGTLERGRWPGQYGRFGYVAKMEPGRRGCVIELGDPAHVQTVKDIFNWYDQGQTIREIGRKLRERGDWQTNRQTHYDWNPPIILRILRSEDYTGKASWSFDDKTYTITIPQIISREQWERVQAKIDGNRQLSTRNAKRTFILQHLMECGECGGKVSPGIKTHYYGRLGSGELKKYYYNPPAFYYRCAKGARVYDLINHPKPYNWEGKALEWAIWRHIVDFGIKRPDFIIEQIQTRQQALIDQGENVDSDINRARLKIGEINQERVFYQRQAARGKITEMEFDARMAETEETARYWHLEIERLQELRDDKAKTTASLDYAILLFETIEKQLSETDIHPDDLKELPEEQRETILKKQQKIVRALCDKIIIYADGHIVIEGLLDGSEIMSFEL